VRRAERVTVFCFRLFRFDQIPNHESPFTDFSPILADEINRGAGITID
jgi:hypothetical protein